MTNKCKTTKTKLLQSFKNALRKHKIKFHQVYAVYVKSVAVQPDRKLSSEPFKQQPQQFFSGN